MGKAGRPRIEIDWISFDKLCAMQATLEEISLFLGVSEDTLERACKRDKGANFADYWAQKAEAGKISLRRHMFEAMQDGNTTMMIFLSKQWLGYADKIEQKHNIKKDETQMTDEELALRTDKLAERLAARRIEKPKGD